jgi:hypothetical protein
MPLTWSRYDTISRNGMCISDTIHISLKSTIYCIYIIIYILHLNHHPIIVLLFSNIHGSTQGQDTRIHHTYNTLWSSNIALETCRFVDDLPYQISWFSMALLPSSVAKPCWSRREATLLRMVVLKARTWGDERLKGCSSWAGHLEPPKCAMTHRVGSGVCWTPQA